MSSIKNIFYSFVLLGLVLNPCAFVFAAGVKLDVADYITVGVGTAGAVLAEKLTKDKKTSVIALHSGENFSNAPLIKTRLAP